MRSRGCRGTPCRISILAAIFGLWLGTAISTAPTPGFAQTDLGKPLAASGVLDGQQFTARIAREDSRSDAAGDASGDLLAFQNGRLSSALCRRYNFADAPHTVRTEGDEIHFSARMESPTDGEMMWVGTVRQGRLEGRMRWKKERWYWSIDVEHRISGSLDKSTAEIPPAGK